MSNRNCVQIGLGKSAEYYYLTADNWRETMKDPSLYPGFNWEQIMETSDPNWRGCISLKHLPQEMCNLEDSRSWTYFGVDCIPEFVEWFRDSYPSNSNTKWLCSQVSSKFPVLKNRNSITLKQLFRKCHIDNIDVLAVDIERHEYDIFYEYDWNIKPKYITIEAHDAIFWNLGSTKKDIDLNKAYPHVKKLIQIILTQGYELFNVDFSNWTPDSSMTRELELQFLSK